MEDWEVKNVIDYSPNGDDIDSFSQKVKAEEEVIYERLNRVRCNDASAGVLLSDAVPYQWHIDTSTEPATIYMYDGQTNAWVKIGTVATAFGLNTTDLGGITNEGGITTMQMGKDAEKPDTAELRALYFAYDAKKIYMWSGVAWDVFLSLDYDDIIDREGSAVRQEDVAYSGPNKIARFDADGKIDADITGSPARIANRPISIGRLQESQSLVYDGTNWVNKGIVTTNDTGLIDGSITGNAAKIANVTIRTNGDLSDGQVLVYRAATNTFTNEQKGTIGAGAALSFQRHGEEIMSYDGSEERTLEFDDFAKEAVGVGTDLPDPAPLHFVEVQA